jgi:hypothetical protein
MYVGLGFRGFVPWFALYRVDAVAEALSICAIVVLTSGTTFRRVLIAALLAGVALLTKQSFAAATVAGTVYLWTLSPRRSLIYGTVALVPVALVCLAEERATGAFVANAFAVANNPDSIDQFIALGSEFVQSIGLPVLIAGLYVIFGRPWQTSRGKLLVIYWVVSFLPLLGLLKFGAAQNYWIEFAAATSVLAAAGLWLATSDWRTSRVAATFRALALVLVFNLIIAVPSFAQAAIDGLTNGAMLTWNQPEKQAEFAALVRRVHDVPGPVLAEPADVLVLASRPILLEPVLFSGFAEEHRWDPTPLANGICAGDVKLLVLAFPIDLVARYAPYGQPWWPPQVMQALQHCMRLDTQTAGRFLYTPAAQLS